MVSAWLVLWVVGCVDERPPPPVRTPEQSGEVGVGDTASGGPDETEDSGVDPGDTPEDTGDPRPEACEAVTFTGEDGTTRDLTAVFLQGDMYVFDEPGTLTLCPGEWFVHMLVMADLDVRGLGETRLETVLSGGEQDSVITVLGPAAMSLSNATVERGVARGAGNEAVGGGLRCRDDGRLVLENVVIQDNEAYDGGGIYAQGCDLVLRDTRFLRNTALDDGGAISLWGVDMSVEDSLFQDNASLDGAAIHLYYSAVEIEDTTFQENRAAFAGGALANLNGSDLFVKGSLFLNNSAGYYGGAAVLYSDASLEGVRFEGNTLLKPGAHGGALFYSSVGSAEGSMCDFAGNAPTDIEAHAGDPLMLGDGASFQCSGAGCVEL